eukprot:3231570-Rhodomonas_salina.2
MCGRHDDKRGDYAGRLQNSLDFLLYQARKFHARIEIVVVEWNPLPDASRLSSLLRVPPNSATPVRIITVPGSFHQSVQGDTQQDFFEFMAKNVGARRARGKFVLFSNGDVLLSDDVMRMFAEERLDTAAFYRIARTELPGLMDPLSPLTLRMEAMEELLGVLGEEHTCKSGEKECPGEYNRGICEAMGQIPERIAEHHLGLEDQGFLPAAGDFFLIARQVLHRMGGYHQVNSASILRASCYALFVLTCDMVLRPGREHYAFGLYARMQGTRDAAPPGTRSCPRMSYARATKCPALVPTPALQNVRYWYPGSRYELIWAELVQVVLLRPCAMMHQRHPVKSAMCLRVRYAFSSTDTAYGATRLLCSRSASSYR